MFERFTVAMINDLQGQAVDLNRFSAQSNAPLDKLFVNGWTLVAYPVGIARMFRGKIKKMAPCIRGHLRNRSRISRAGFGLHGSIGRCVFDDNLLVLMVAIMPRVHESTMQTAIMFDYDLVHAGMMPLLDVVRRVRL
jgi:hypothetical protein